nr:MULTISPECIES: hypothetical protein [Nocardia]
MSTVLESAPISLPRTPAAGPSGASPSTVPPSVVQARTSAAMAVVFPVPAGAIATCNRRLEVANSRSNWTWPSLSIWPLLLAACFILYTARMKPANQPIPVEQYRQTGRSWSYE